MSISKKFFTAGMIILLPVIIIQLACKKDKITDPEPDPEPVYTKVELKSFTVTQIPFTQPGGASWEDLPIIELGPDVYWILTDSADSAYYGTRDVRFDNVTNVHLPLVRIPATPLILSPLSASWFIKIYDYDLLGGDDLMATLGPFNFESFKQGLPDVITVSGDSAIVDLAIEWKE